MNSGCLIHEQGILRKPDVVRALPKTWGRLCSAALCPLPALGVSRVPYDLIRLWRSCNFQEVVEDIQQRTTGGQRPSNMRHLGVTRARDSRHPSGLGFGRISPARRMCDRLVRPHSCAGSGVVQRDASIIYRRANASPRRHHIPSRQHHASSPRHHISSRQDHAWTRGSGRAN
jgi:hypothetical protein